MNKVILIAIITALLLATAIGVGVFLWPNSEPTKNEAMIPVTRSPRVTQTPRTRAPRTTTESIETTTLWDEIPPSLDLNQCRVKECGKTGPKFEGNRRYGRDAEKEEFPYHVAFHYRSSDRVWCGGSMLNERWILTSAKCIDEKDPWWTELSVGITGRDEIYKNSQGVQHYWLHPLYEKGKDDYDIALVRSSEPLKNSSFNYINPICLPFEDVPDATHGIVSGFRWDNLMTTKLKIKSHENCKANYSFYNPETMICAGDTVHDTCKEDMGGPLVVKNAHGSYVLKGVTSSGKCDAQNTPSVYMNVSHFMHWICGTMVNHGLD